MTTQPAVRRAYYVGDLEQYRGIEGYAVAVPRRSKARNLTRWQFFVAGTTVGCGEMDLQFLEPATEATPEPASVTSPVREGYWTLPEAARALGVGNETLRVWLKQGKVKGEQS